MIDEEILRLPPRFRGPVVLCYLEGVSHEEAARQLGCPLGTVNSRLATARQRLRSRLTKRGMAPSGALVGTTRLSGVATAAVPAPLLRATSSAALQVANGSPATGTAGATAVVLAPTAVAPGTGARNKDSQPAVNSDQGIRREDVAVPVTSRVRMPDGSPAAGATVEAIIGTDEPTISVHTDDTGRFQLQGVFGTSGLLHASSADGKHQTPQTTPAASRV